MRSVFVIGLALAVSGEPCAQMRAHDMASARRSAGLYYHGDGRHPGSFVIQYGQPEWKAEYDRRIEADGAMSMRLGKDFWTTLDTSLPLRIGGVEVAPGYYYALLRRDAEQRWFLVLRDAAKARAEKLVAGHSAQLEDGIRAPLRLRPASESTARLTIGVVADPGRAERSTLVVRWGKHRLESSIFAALGPEHTPPAVQVRDAIRSMIALLMAGKHRELIVEHADPTWVAKREADGRLDRTIAAFSADKAAEMLSALRRALEADVRFGEDGTTATIAPGGDDRRKLEFVRIDERWYVKN